MDAHVPNVEPGENVTADFEGNTMPCSETPENSDVALFKQQISQTNATLGKAVSASELTDASEQTEGLIDLSRRFKALLEKVQPSGQSSDDNATLSSLDKKTPKGTNVDINLSDKTGKSGEKESALGQDSSYVTPLGAPSVSHVTATAQNAETSEVHAAMISQQIKDQIIDRILVSTNDIAANKTVKVVINPTVLEGTEVNFQKVGDSLTVQFASRNESSLQFLHGNQADLQGYLQGELKQFKDVVVSVKSHGNNTEYPEDGRSRNRYEYQTLDEDEQ